MALAPTQPSSATTPASSRPCIRALHLSEATAALVREVSRAVRREQEESGQGLLLAAKTMIEAKNWSSLAVSSESWEKVASIRTQLMSETDALVPVIRAVNPAAVYLYERPLIVQLHRGLTPMRDFLTMAEDCGLVMPLLTDHLPAADTELAAWDETRGQDRYRLALSPAKAFVVAGTAVLQMAGPNPNPDPLVCVVFCLAAGGREEEV